MSAADDADRRASIDGMIERRDLDELPSDQHARALAAGSRSSTEADRDNKLIRSLEYDDPELYRGLLDRTAGGRRAGLRIDGVELHVLARLIRSATADLEYAAEQRRWEDHYGPAKAELPVPLWRGCRALPANHLAGNVAQERPTGSKDDRSWLGWHSALGGSTPANPGAVVPPHSFEASRSRILRKIRRLLGAMLRLIESTGSWSFAGSAARAAPGTAWARISHKVEPQ